MKQNRWILLGTILILSVLALTGCGQPKPQEVVTSFLDALAEGRYADAEELIEGTDEEKGYLFGTLNSGAQSEEEKEADRILACIFQSIRYGEVGNVCINEDVCTVSAELTTLDAAILMQNAADEIEGAKEGSDRSIEEIRLEHFQAKDAPRMTKTVEISLQKTGEVWKIRYDPVLLEGVTGGLTNCFIVE